MAGKRTAKKTATKKTTTKATNKNSLDVTFESDIPKIERQGVERRSKYQELLDKIRERTEAGTKNPVAMLQFEETGQATSRYTSIKDAVSKREDADHWTVAVRRNDGGYGLFIRFDEEVTEDEEPEEEDTDTEEDEDEDLAF